MRFPFLPTLVAAAILGSGTQAQTVIDNFSGYAPVIPFPPR